MGVDIKHLATGTAGTPTGQALHQNIEFNVNQQCGLQGLAHAGEEFIQLFGLGNVAWKAIENEAFLGIGFGKPLFNHAQHNVIRDQLSCIHRRFCLHPKWGTGSNRFT